MSSSQSPRDPSVKREEWFTYLAERQQQFAYALFGLAALLAVIPLVIGIKYKSEYLWVCIETLIPVVVAAAAGAFSLSRFGSKITAIDAIRIQVLCVGGVIGLSLILVALTLAFHWWEHIAGGLTAWQGEQGWRVWVFLLLQIGGLALMFLSLQFARTEERENALLRRLLYGYNAGLAGLLLLEILLVLNILTTAFLPASDDWTTRSIYTLSSKSENILKGLDKPTRVYVILPRQRYFLSRDMKALMENCRAVNNRIQVEYLSPDLDRERVAELAQKYQFSERDGVLVVYGNEPNIEHQFIKTTALETADNPFGRQRQPRFFKGEAELAAALNSLSEGKQKAVVYFMQGNGELDIGDTQVRELDKGAGVLKQRLEASNVTVKGLEISPVPGLKSKRPDVVVESGVPKDATVVVIAGPRQRFPEYTLKSLREYMNPPAGSDKPKGKMIVLLDLVINPDGKMEQLGLKEFLSEFNVQVGDNRVLHLGLRSPYIEVVTAVLNPSDTFRAKNPIAAAFPNSAFRLVNVRTVEPATGARPDSSHYLAEPLLVVPYEDRIWAEADLKSNPIQIVRRLRSPEHQDEAQAKISRDDLSVAVVVTEQAARSDPHAMPQPGEDKPRLVVCGDATLACNAFMQEEAAARYFDLFNSMLSWLRERPSSIGFEPKKQSVYEVDPVDVNTSRMILFPTALFFVGIVGLGAGVWIVRRR